MSEYTPKQWKINNMVTKTKIEKLKALVNELSEYLDSDDFVNYVADIVSEIITPTSYEYIKRVDCVVAYNSSTAYITSSLTNIETFEEFRKIFFGSSEPNPFAVDGVAYNANDNTVYRLVFIEAVDVSPQTASAFELCYVAGDEYNVDPPHKYCVVTVTKGELGDFVISTCEYRASIA